MANRFDVAGPNSLPIENHRETALYYLRRDETMDLFQQYARNLTRRHFFQQGSNVLGGVALASLMGQGASRTLNAAEQSPNLQALMMHHAPKAKHVIYWDYPFLRPKERARRRFSVAFVHIV